MFHKVVWQHMQRVVVFLITSLLQIYQGIFQSKSFVKRLRFDRIMAMSLWPHFLAQPVPIYQVVPRPVQKHLDGNSKHNS